MAVVGGIILWLVLIALIVGYVVIKKFGDKKELHFRSFVSEKRASEDYKEEKDAPVNQLST
jgi:hypothetical protein